MKNARPHIWLVARPNGSNESMMAVDYYLFDTEGIVKTPVDMIDC